MNTTKFCLSDIKVAASPKVKVKRILEVLFPEKTSPGVKSNLIRESSAFWKHCSRKKRCRSAFWKYCSIPFYFGSTNPGKTRAYHGRALQCSRWPNFTFFYFYFSGDSTSIFPGIVLPFCYFSVLRKVTEKPVLFLPHP